MKKTKLELFKDLGRIADNLKPMPNSYWEKEDKLIEQMMKRNEAERKRLVVSYEKYHKKFDL